MAPDIVDGGRTRTYSRSSEASRASPRALLSFQKTKEIEDSKNLEIEDSKNLEIEDSKNLEIEDSKKT